MKILCKKIEFFFFFSFLTLFFFIIVNQDTIIGCCGNELKFFRKGDNILPTFSTIKFTIPTFKPLKCTALKNVLLVSSKITHTENKKTENFYEMWCFPLDEKIAPFGLLRKKKNVIISDFIVLSPSLMVLARINEEKKSNSEEFIVKDSILELYSFSFTENPKQNESPVSLSKINSIFKIPSLFNSQHLKLKNFKNENKFFLFSKSKIFFLEIKNQKDFFVINETLMNPLYCCIDSILITQNWDDFLICLDLYSGIFIHYIHSFYFHFFYF
jgi:hypothetical protein